MEGSRTRIWLGVAAVLLLAILGAVAIVVLTGGEEEAEAQTVSFEAATASGADPFTPPADKRGRSSVPVGSGPFGGSGSDLVCDRELLISSLKAQPDRLAEWARVLGVEPTASAVTAYIRSLRAVTLTQDTRVTNHSFIDGRAVAFQSILQAGTAVLVDKDGVPVARCRCGNPLLQPIFIPTAECTGCPPDYEPPPACTYYDFRDTDFRRFTDARFVSLYRGRTRDDNCYRIYPDPPRVDLPRERVRRTPTATATPEPTTPAEPARSPSASFSPSAGTVDDTYTLFASGFRSNVTLSVRLVRPDGVVESYSITTGSDGSGSYTFPRASDPVTGTYTATVTDSGTGDSATATTSVSPRAETAPAEPDTSALQCDPARSQLEFEQCRDAGLLPEQQ